MSDRDSKERIEKMKEMEGGPGVEEILEVYDGNSGYIRRNTRSPNYMFDSETKPSYSDSSA